MINAVIHHTHESGVFRMASDSQKKNIQNRGGAETPANPSPVAPLPAGTQFFRRVLVMTLGLSILSSGIVLAVKANIGVSSFTSLPYTLSQLWGIDLGYMQFMVSVCLVLAQIPLLGRKFTAKKLLPLVSGFVNSCFIFLAEHLYSFVHPTVYWQRLLLCLFAFSLMAAGIYLTVTADLFVDAPESFVQTLSEVLHRPFHVVKTWADCFFVSFSALIGLIFAGRLLGVREGTLLAALSIGRIIGLFPDGFKARVQRFCYGSTAATDTPSVQPAPESTPENAPD